MKKLTIILFMIFLNVSQLFLYGNSPSSDNFNFNFNYELYLHSGVRIKNNVIGGRLIPTNLTNKFKIFSNYSNFTFNTEFDVNLYNKGNDFIFKINQSQPYLFFDLRKFNIHWNATNYLSFDLGRKIFTWGVGDIFFVNDYFPKNFSSLINGYKLEYYRVPIYHLSTTLLLKYFNIDIIYSPQKNTDIFMTDPNLSFWNPFLKRIYDNSNINLSINNDIFNGSEFYLKVDTKLNNYTIDLYYFKGTNNSPNILDLLSKSIKYSRSCSYGLLIQRSILNGIFDFEFSYNETKENLNNFQIFLKNDEIKFLISYNHRIYDDNYLTLQYFNKSLINYDELKVTYPLNYYYLLPEKNNNLVSVRLDNELSLSDLTYNSYFAYSFDEKDYYLSLLMKYRINNNNLIGIKSSTFGGNYNHTYFSQLKFNSNLALNYTIYF